MVQQFYYFCFFKFLHASTTGQGEINKITDELLPHNGRNKLKIFNKGIKNITREGKDHSSKQIQIYS